MTAEPYVEVLARQPGGPDVLEVARGSGIPRPGRGQVLIEVAAAGVNRPDVMQRNGTIPAPTGAPAALGLEAAGTVIDLGDGVTALEPGDRVAALLNGGGYATHCLAEADLCLKMPDKLTFQQAAGLPEALFTGWFNLFELGQLEVGNTVLIHGATGGVGNVAIQAARAAGARVIASTRDAEKARDLVAMGASIVVDHSDPGFPDKIMSQTGGAGVDVVLDIFGGATMARNLACLAPGGRHVGISFVHGPEVAIHMGMVMSKGLVLTSSTLRPQPIGRKIAIADAVRLRLWPLVEAGTISVPVFRALPLAEAAEAHRILESRVHTGKIILLPNPHIGEP